MSVRNRVLGAILLALLIPVLAIATPLGRSFTYQGELNQSGTPVDGTVHLRFSLWDAAGTGTPPVGGTQIGSSQIITNVSVDDGLFTAEVNAGDPFGASAFNGQARWLQIEVCTDGTCTSSTVLGPRQALTAAPYALGPWYIEGTNLSYAGGNVGIGTTNPQNLLHVNGSMRWGGEVSNYTYTGIDGSGMFIEQKGISTATSRVRVQSSKSGNQLDYSQFNIDPVNGFSFLRQGTGVYSVGIGTQTPAAALDVRGSIRLGASGEYQVPAVSGNLKIVRGTVSAAGNPLPGMESSLSVNLVLTGVYNIAFTPAFAGRPTITVTCESSGADRIAMLDSVINGSCTVRVVSGSGTPVNCQFDLIAIGVR